MTQGDTLPLKLRTHSIIGAYSRIMGVELNAIGTM